MSYAKLTLGVVQGSQHKKRAQQDAEYPMWTTVLSTERVAFSLPVAVAWGFSVGSPGLKAALT